MRGRRAWVSLAAGLPFVTSLATAAAQVTLVDPVQFTARTGTQLAKSENPNDVDVCQKVRTLTGVTSTDNLACASSSSAFGGSSATADTSYEFRLDATSTLPNSPLSGIELEFSGEYAFNLQDDEDGEARNVVALSFVSGGLTFGAAAGTGFSIQLSSSSWTLGRSQVLLAQGCAGTQVEMGRFQVGTLGFVDTLPRSGVFPTTGCYFLSFFSESFIQTIGGGSFTADEADSGSLTLAVQFGPGEGACCLPGGGCTEVSLTDCQAQGEFQGDATTCGDPGICAPDEDFVDWVNGGGGSFGVESNWDPAEVPSETQTARFQLPGIYIVENALARVRRAVVTAGTVALRGGPLELLEQSLALPSASIGDGGRLNLLAASSVRSSHVSVGAGGNLGSGISVSGAGTRWESSGRFTVGDASFAELTVAAGGTLVSAESRIGENADGEASVEGEDSSWTTGNIAVGNRAEGKLTIADGGVVSSGEGRLGLTLSGFGFVEVLGKGAGGLASAWRLDTLRVGAGGQATLIVEDGGNVSVVDLVEVGNQSFGGITVTKTPSALDTARLVVGGTGALGGSVDVTAGGRVVALDTQLGPGAGEGDMTVAGSVDFEDAVKKAFSTLTLSVRRGTLRIGNDQVFTFVESDSAVVAGPAANVVVSGVLTGWSTQSLRIGASEGPGTVTLEDGGLDIELGGLFVSSVGTLAGTGSVSLEGPPVELFAQLGTISPSITFTDPEPEVRLPAARAGGLRALALAEPAALVIDGDLALGAPAVLRIPIAGPESFGILRVTGDTTLAGTLELRFVDGFLPTADTAFEVLRVDGAANGGFDRIVVRGVNEALPFATSVVDGDLTFTALADAKACGSGDGNGDGLADCERCDDCIDDDGDGLVDRADPDCAPAANGAGLGIGGDAGDRKALGKCAATMAAVGAKVAALVATRLQKCTDAVLACVQTKPDDATCLEKATVKCAKATAGLAPDGNGRRKARLTIAKACGAKTPGAPPAVPLATIVAATGLGFAAEVARCAALATPVLASVDDVIACIDRATVCRASALFAGPVPRARELLHAGNAEATLLACMPGGVEDAGAFGDPKTSGKPLTKCQKAIAAAGAKLTARLTKGYGACAGAMRACVQSPDPAACLIKAQAGCTKATRALPTVSGGADAKLLAAITKACGGLDVAALLAPNGLGFNAAGTRCAALGVAALDGPAALATCLTREQACGTATLVEAATPRLREWLSRGGV